MAYGSDRKSKEAREAEDFAKAERLLFCPSDERSIHAMVGQWLTVRSLSGEDRGATDRGRPLGSAASRNENGTLFS